MQNIRIRLLIGAACFATFGLVATGALACKPGHCRVDQGIGGAFNPRHGCNQLMIVLYPNMERHARRAERNKCLVDPESYSKKLSPG